MPADPLLIVATAPGGEPVTRPASQWGVRSCDIRLGSGLVDTAALTTGERLNVAPQWSKDTTLQIFAGTTCLFVGRVVAPETVGTAATREKSYTVAGPSHRLKRIQYKQDWVTTGTASFFAFARAFLFNNGRGTAEEIAAAVGRTATAIPGALAAGTIDAQVYPPPQTVDNFSCLQVIQRCLRLLIDGAAWWDYTQPVPTLHCRRYPDLQEITVNAGAGTGTELEVSEIYEQPVPYIRVVLKRQTADEETGDFGTTPTQVLYPTGYDANAPGAEEGGVDVSIDYDPAFTEIEALNAAQTVYEAMNRIAWQGMIQEKALNLAMRPGLRLQVTGQLPAHATMGALVQEVRHTFRGSRRSTTARFGPPNQLAVQDIAERIRFWRGRRPSPNELTEQSTGTSPTENYGFEKRDDKDNSKPSKLLAGFTIQDRTVPTVNGWKQMTLLVKAETNLASPIEDVISVPVVAADGSVSFMEASDCGQS